MIILSDIISCLYCFVDYIVLLFFVEQKKYIRHVLTQMCKRDLKGGLQKKTDYLNVPSNNQIKHHRIR